MKVRDAEKLLKDHGFKFTRQTKVGQIWTDGMSTICVGRDLETNWRNEKNLQAEIKRAVAKRPTEVVKKLDHVPVGCEESKLQRAFPALQREEFLKREAREAKRIEPKKAWIAVQKETEHKPMTTTLEAILSSKVHLPDPIKAPEPVKEEKPRLEGTRQLRRFDSATRFIVKERIKELFIEGCSRGEIIHKMNAEGFTYSNGDPMDLAYVSHTILECVKKGIKPRPKSREVKVPPPPVEKMSWERNDVEVKAAPQDPPAAPEPAPVVESKAAAPQAPVKLPTSVLAILTDPALSETKKIKMLQAFSKPGRLPEAPRAILTDPDLLDDEKINMLIAYIDI